LKPLDLENVDVEYNQHKQLKHWSLK